VRIAIVDAAKGNVARFELTDSLAICLSYLRVARGKVTTATGYLSRSGHVQRGSAD